MVYEPGFWLFGLAIGLLFAGILGVVLSTRRVAPGEAPGVAGSVTGPAPEPGAEMVRLHELEQEVEQLRAERDELRGILGRLAVLLDRRYPEPPAGRRAHLVASGPAAASDDRERRAGGG
jgi:hypothetical protein